jgi:hypothetical protein
MDDHTWYPPVISVREPASGNTRRVADLELHRVVPALLLAPLLPALLLMAVALLPDSDIGVATERVNWRMLAYALGMPETWSLICGVAYMQMAARIRGTISRVECLMLGCGSAFLLPTFLVTAADTIDRMAAPQISVRVLQYCAVAGLFALPFGLFGGWLFWRIGVRPARETAPDVSAVFE